MFKHRFTKRARRVVVGAMATVDTGGDVVDPAALFRALLADRDCLAVAVLIDLGVTLRVLEEGLTAGGAAPGDATDELDEEDAAALEAIGIDLDEVRRRIGPVPGAEPTPARGRRRFTRGARKSLELALREAVALGHGYIGTEHLLLGLARSDDPAVARALDVAEVDRPALRDAVREAVRRAG